MNDAASIDRRVFALLAEAVPYKAKKTGITGAQNLQKDLGLDSLGVASVLFRLEAEYGADFTSNLDLTGAIGRLRTVDDLTKFGRELLHASDK